MKYRKLIIPVLFLVLLVSNVYSFESYDATNNYLNATRVFHLDNNCGDSLGIENCENSNGIYDSSTIFDSGQSLYYDGTDNDYLNTSWGAGLNFRGAWSISMWVRTNVTQATNDKWFGSSDGTQTTDAKFSTTYGHFITTETSGVTNSWIAGYNRDKTGYADTAWKMITITHDAGTGTGLLHYYTNSTLVANQYDLANLVSDSVHVNDFFVFAMNTNGIDSANIQGYVDDVIIWGNISLTLQNITDLYNGVFAGSPPPSDELINMSVVLPITESQFNTETLNINLTVDSSYTFNCSLYYNSVVNVTITDYSAGENIPVNFNLIFSPTTETNFTYYVNCSSGNQSKQSTGANIYIDNVNPLMYWGTPAKNNSTIVNRLSDGFLYTNITIIDNNLYSYHINISYYGGDVIYNLSNTSLLGYNSYNINNWFNMTNYSGVFETNVEVCDGHTVDWIPSYELKDGLFNQYIGFVTDDNYIEIKLKENSWFDEWTATKLVDRYNFEVEPNTKGLTSYTFTVEADQYIDIINTKGEYKNYIISGHNWMDFIIPDQPQSTVTIKRITGTEVEITIGDLINPQKITFNSIGELNCISETSQFFVFNATQTSEGTKFVGEATTFVFNVTFNSSFMNKVTAILSYNNTNYTVTGVNNNWVYSFSKTLSVPSVTSETKVPYQWYYAVNTTTESYPYSLAEANQTVYPIFITNCTGGTTNNTINFTIYNEVDLSLITPSSLTASFDLWGSNTSYTPNFYFDLDGGSTYSFCINPDSANFTGNAEINYEATGYATRTYYMTNYVFDNETDVIPLYLVNTSSSTIFTITDFDSGEVIEDVNNLMYKFIGGSWVIVDNKQSDITGKVQFYYVPSVKYKFELTKAGYEDKEFELNPILYATYDIKMFSTTLINYTQDFDQISLTYSPHIFDNDATTTFSFLITAPDAVLTSYGYVITYPGGTDTVTGTTAGGELLFNNISITGATTTDVVQLDYFYVTDLAGRRDFTALLNINLDLNSTTFMKNRGETYGLTAFERILIMTIGVIMIVGIASLIGALIPGLFLGLIMFGYCVFIGFIPIWSILPSMFIGMFYLVWKSGG